MAKIVRLILWNAILTLFLIELVLNFFPAPIFRLDITNGDSQYQLSENNKLIYEPKPGTGKFNSYGHRGEEYAYEKTNPRVIFIGDSVLEGLGIRNPIDRFTEKLEVKEEIINLGVRGYNIIQEVEYMKTKGLSFDPDYIIFAITSNDLTLSSGEVLVLNEKLEKMKKSSFYNNYYHTQNAVEKLLFKTQTYKHVRYLTSNKEKSEIKYTITPEELKATIKELSKIKPKIAFLFMPVRDSPEQMETIKKEIQNAGIHYFDLNEYPFQDKEALFSDRDPIHFDRRGHAQIAQVITENWELILPKN